MIYTRKKNPKFLDFFCRKKWNFRGILLEKKKRCFLNKTKKKLFGENRKKVWKIFCRPPNVFWRLIRHHMPLGKNGQCLHHIIMIFRSKSEKMRGKFRIFFLVSAEVSALRAEKQHLLKNFFLSFWLNEWKNILWKYKKIPFHTKKVISSGGFWSRNRNYFSFGSPWHI